MRNNNFESGYLEHNDYPLPDGRAACHHKPERNYWGNLYDEDLYEEEQPEEQNYDYADYDDEDNGDSYYNQSGYD